MRRSRSGAGRSPRRWRGSGGRCVSELSQQTADSRQQHDGGRRSAARVTGGPGRASGFTGALAAQLAWAHPRFQLVGVTARSEPGTPLTVSTRATGSRWRSRSSTSTPPARPTRRSSPIRTAPRRRSSRRCASAASGSWTCRPTSGSATRRSYRRWYGEPAAPELAREAVYGLTELYRDRIAGARAGRQPRLLPDRRRARAGAARRRRADRGRRRRRQVRRIGRGAGGRRAPPLRLGGRELHPLRDRRAPTRARDRAGAERRSGADAPADLRAPSAAARPGRAGELLRAPQARRSGGRSSSELYRERYADEPFVELAGQPPGRARRPRHQPVPDPPRVAARAGA